MGMVVEGVSYVCGLFEGVIMVCMYMCLCVMSGVDLGVWVWVCVCVLCLYMQAYMLVGAWAQVSLCVNPEVDIG